MARREFLQGEPIFSKLASGTLWDKFEELGSTWDALTPQDVNWMSDETSMEPFIRWFLVNISADNVLNHSELEEYQKLCDAGREMHGKSLDDALREASHPVDDLPVDAFDLLEEKDEICFLMGQAEILSSVKEQLQNSSEKEKSEELVLYKRLQDKKSECFKDGQFLMKLNVHIKNSLTNFYQSLQQLTSTCLNYKNEDICNFLAQAPLEDFLMQCSTFEHNVKVFIKRQFEGKELTGKPNMELLSLMLSDEFEDKEESNIFNNDAKPGEFKIHPKTLWEAEIRKVSAVAKLKSVQAALECAGSLDMKTVKLSSVRSEQDCSILESEIDLLRQQEMSTAAQNYVVAKIAAIAEDFARRKSERRRYRLNKLQLLRENFTWHVLLTDVLWMLLRREKKLVDLAAEFIDESVTTLDEEHTKHLAVMKLHQETQQKYAAFLKSAALGHIPLVDSLRRMMSVDETEDIWPVVNALKELSKRVEEVDQTNFMTGSSVRDLVMEKDLNLLQEKLFAGPTRELLLIPADIAQNIGSVGNTIKELDTEIKRLKRNFSSKQELYSKYPIQRYSQLLWAWFLADPSQLRAVLKNVEEVSEEHRNF